MWIPSTFALLSACGLTLPDARIDTVTPDRGWNGEVTVLSIQGEGFFPRVLVDASRGDADVDQGFRAWLRDDDGSRRALSGVAAVDYGSLRAVVEPGLSPGLYDVVVQGPSDREAVLEDAFVVAATRADRLRLDTPSAVATVNEGVQFTVRLLDPNEAQVEADLEVRVTLTGTQGAPDATVTTSLDGPVFAEDGSVLGSLGPDGEARLNIAVHRPDTVNIAVEAVDPQAGIRGDAFRHAWLTGDQLDVDIQLPPDLQPSANEQFSVRLRLLDQFGNLVEGASTSVLVRTACQDFATAVQLSGEQFVSVRPVAATVFNADRCQQQYVEVVGVPAGRSASFDVWPGPAVALSVRPVFSVIRAGGTMLALVESVDGFGNRAGPTTDLQVADDQGGIDDFTCEPTALDDLVCTAVATVAGDEVRMLVSDDDLEGISAPYVVLPSPQLDALTVEGPSQVEAGQAFQLLVDARDPYGNRMLPQEVPALTVDLGDPDGGCAPLQPLADGRVVLGCQTTTARSDALFTLTHQDRVATVGPVDVRNGPAAAATLTTPSQVSAGEVFPVHVSVTDAWGNPYLHPTGGPLQLQAVEAATLAWPVPLVDGSGVVDVQLTVAGPWTLELLQGTVPLATSAPIEVRPGDAASLDVEATAPWAWVGQPVAVDLTARDMFGNLSPVELDVTVSSAGGPSPTILLEGGVAQLDYVWSDPGLQVQLQAASGTVAGASAPLDVVDACAEGPQAVLALGSGPRACLVAAVGEATVTADLSGSVAGAAALSTYRVAADEQVFLAPSPTVEAKLATPGRRDLRGLVVDEAFCADEVVAPLWVGADDGSAVGPIPMTMDATGPIGASYPISVGPALDCTGDPAVGATVWARTDRGTLTGLAPTGSGLATQLGASGLASFALDAAVGTGGPATVTLWGTAGQADGQQVIELVGDAQRPVVWEQDPVGDQLVPVDTIRFRFDEPMLDLTVTPAAFLVFGPELREVTQATLVEPSLVELTLDLPADPAEGTWTLQALPSLRDLAGNRLDGAGTQNASPWTAVFGALPSALSPISCEAEPLTFRPDGDDGVGVESDTLDVLVDASAPPASWRVSVRTTSGELLARHTVAAVAASDVVAWDGRAADGGVMADGAYLLEVEAVDGVGNLAGGCSLEVSVDNGRQHGG